MITISHMLIDDIDPCLFDPDDAWFGRRFIGDTMYRAMYNAYIDSLVDFDDYDRPVKV